MDISTSIAKLLIRIPPWGSIGGIVGITVTLSYLVGLILIDPALMPERVLSLVRAISIGMPILVATPVAAVIVALVHSLESARREAQHLANTDILTGVLNRRHFFEIACRELALAHDTRSPFTVLLFDVDDFKQVNDNYGHDAGDAVLKMVAQRCKGVLHPRDSFARWGGEEFVAVLPRVDPAESLNIALRIKEAIASGSVRTASGATISVTASIGLASESDCSHVHSLDSLINRADHAMYAAKRKGKNTAVMAPVTMS